jgi:hypothetical protein
MGEESRFQTKLLNDLRSLGKCCVATKIIKASDNGIPDIYFTTALTGPVFIETKKPKGKVSKAQEVKITKLNTCGALSFVCYTWAQWWQLKKNLGLLDMNKIYEAHEKLRKRVLSN